MANPFTPGKTSFIDFETMSDLKWHCAKCELKSGQAKTWQIWRQMGIQLKTDENGRWEKRMECRTCRAKTVHRGLASLEILPDTTIRAGLPPGLSKRVKQVYRNQEAMLLRELPPGELEVDHRFPQVRWSKNEDKLPADLPDGEIRKKFILLTRSNNLLKSRNCERCAKTGERGTFPGVNYWYEGGPKWNPKIANDDERGCIGCFWYDPYEWRKRLNALTEASAKK